MRLLFRRLLPPLDPALADRIREQIAAQRGRAHALYRAAWWLERFGILPRYVHAMRHDARLAFRMAAKMQRGLDTGVYRLGRRMFPAVEDMCGCAEYCHRDRS